MSILLVDKGSAPEVILAPTNNEHVYIWLEVGGSITRTEQRSAGALKHMNKLASAGSLSKKATICTVLHILMARNRLPK